MTTRRHCLSCSKGTTLMGDVNSRSAVCAAGEAMWELFTLHSSSVDPKLL